MGAMSDYLVNKIRDWHDDIAFPTDLATVYLALYTTATGPAAEGTEVSGGSYARVAIAAASISRTARTWTTSADVETPVATGSWGVITHAALHDASTAGNRIAYAPLAAQLTVISTQKIRFVAGSITWSATAL